MIVLTLKAVKITRGPMILTECRMAQLANGDLLHCEPDFGATMLVKYPENLEKVGHSERATTSPGARWEIERVAASVKPEPVAAESPLKDVVEDRSMATSKNRKRATTREAST